MEDKSIVFIFIDDEPKPVASFISPVHFELDTRKLADGNHTLKIVGRDPTGKEGIQLIPFEVRNGPAIAVDGMKKNAIVDGIVPLMIHAYSKGDQKKFLIDGSETPKSVPAWVWILIIGFAGWALFYLFTYINMK